MRGSDEVNHVAHLIPRDEAEDYGHWEYQKSEYRNCATKCEDRSGNEDPVGYRWCSCEIAMIGFDPIPMIGPSREGHEAPIDVKYGDEEKAYRFPGGGPSSTRLDRKPSSIEHEVSINDAGEPDPATDDYED